MKVIDSKAAATRRTDAPIAVDVENEEGAASSARGRGKAAPWW